MYKGIFTINAVMVMIHHILIRNWEGSIDIFIWENINRWEFCLYIIKILNNRGKLAVIV